MHALNDTNPSTRELWARLFKASTASTYLSENGDITLPCFSDYLVQLTNERKLKRESVIAAANIERSFDYRLYN